MLIHARTSVTDMNYHLVFVTKYRKSIFTTPELKNKMKLILKSIATYKGVTIQSMEVIDDHVQLIITFPPKCSSSDVVKSFKGASAREWFKAFPDDRKRLWKGHLWSNTFFMSTIGNVSKDIVEEYIKNQIKHSLEAKKTQKQCKKKHT